MTFARGVIAVDDAGVTKTGGVAATGNARLNDVCAYGGSPTVDWQGNWVANPAQPFGTAEPPNGLQPLDQGNWIVQPNATFSGTVTRGYTTNRLNGPPPGNVACDNRNANVIVTIIPVAVQDVSTNAMNVAQGWNVGDGENVLANDMGLNAAGAHIDTVTNVVTTDVPPGGTFNMNNGAWTFTPPTNWSGTVTIPYSITGAGGISDPSSLVIHVLPQAVDDARTYQLNTPTSGNVLPNDGGTGLGNVTMGTPDYGGCVGCSLTIDPSGTYHFTPAPGFAGTVSVQYTTTDADGQATSATLTLTEQALLEAVDDGTYNVPAPNTWYLSTDNAVHLIGQEQLSWNDVYPNGATLTCQVATNFAGTTWGPSGDIYNSAGADIGDIQLIAGGVPCDYQYRFANGTPNGSYYTHYRLSDNTRTDSAIVSFSQGSVAINDADTAWTGGTPDQRERHAERPVHDRRHRDRELARQLGGRTERRARRAPADRRCDVERRLLELHPERDVLRGHHAQLHDEPGPLRQSDGDGDAHGRPGRRRGHLDRELDRRPDRQRDDERPRPQRGRRADQRRHRHRPDPGPRGGRVHDGRYGRLELHSAATWSGTFQVSYSATGAGGTSAPTTLTITTRPLAAVDSGSFVANQTKTGNVLTNDAGTALTVTASGPPVCSPNIDPACVVTISPSGNYTFVAPASWTGGTLQVVVPYTATDAIGQTTASTLTLTGAKGLDAVDDPTPGGAYTVAANGTWYKSNPASTLNIGGNAVANGSAAVIADVRLTHNDSYTGTPTCAVATNNPDSPATATFSTANTANNNLWTYAGAQAGSFRLDTSTAEPCDFAYNLTNANQAVFGIYQLCDATGCDVAYIVFVQGSSAVPDIYQTTAGGPTVAQDVTVNDNYCNYAENTRFAQFNVTNTYWARRRTSRATRSLATALSRRTTPRRPAAPAR